MCFLSFFNCDTWLMLTAAMKWIKIFFFFFMDRTDFYHTQRRNKVTFDLTWCERPCISLAQSATVHPLSQFVFLCFLRLFLSTPTFNAFNETWRCIYLCVHTLSVVKSRKLMCPLGKSPALLFTALGLLLLLLHQNRSTPFSFSPPSFLYTHTSIFISFLQL